jgi:hypothetical protein
MEEHQYKNFAIVPYHKPLNTQAIQFFLYKIIINDMVQIAAGYMRPAPRMLITETIRLRLHYCVFHIWNSEIG